MQAEATEATIYVTLSKENSKSYHIDMLIGGTNGLFDSFLLPSNSSKKITNFPYIYLFFLPINTFIRDRISYFGQLKKLWNLSDGYWNKFQPTSYIKNCLV